MGKVERKRRLGDEEPAHKMTELNESRWLVVEVKKAQRGEVGYVKTRGSRRWRDQPLGGGVPIW